MQTQPFEKHVWAEIDLDALRHNFRAVKARAGEMPLCAVVKADSYGHGAVQCARIFAEEGAVCLAVSCLTEAMQLRQDEIRPSLKRDQLLQNAPQTQAGCVVVPKVVE